MAQVQKQEMGSLIDRPKLPEGFPTHKHEASFWEQLGRTIATFGLLEEILGKAIYAFTATLPYSEEEYRKFLPALQKALSDTLAPLADSYGVAAKKNPKMKTNNIDELVEWIKEAAKIRNVLGHGSWGAPDVNGKSLPLFVNKQGDIFNTPIDIAYLKQVQQHVVELICNVIDTVTITGLAFPGGNGPGAKI